MIVAIDFDGHEAALLITPSDLFDLDKLDEEFGQFNLPHHQRYSMFIRWLVSDKGFQITHEDVFRDIPYTYQRH